MRIRQIKPAYWTDARLARLPAATREFYIGLWMLADDAGWLAWDTEEVAVMLYPYKAPGRRANAVEKMVAALKAQGHVLQHDCGHLLIPHLTEHQRFGGRPVYTVRDAHARRCARPIADARHGRVGNGRVGNGSAPAREVETTEETTTFGEAMAAAGVKAEVVGR
jgi:hypothetical protein